MLVMVEVSRCVIRNYTSTDHSNLGYPIWLAASDIAPIGAILVSGLPQLEDHQVSHTIAHGTY
jgi:uncharacterized protein (UPF0303 family)